MQEKIKIKLDMDSVVKTQSLQAGRQHLLAVDYVKLFFCVCIIAMHTLVHEYLPGDLSWYALSIFNRGVQFFFVASGYFLGLKIYESGNPTDSIIRYCKRLLKPYIVFSVVWILQRIITLAVKEYAAGEIVAEILQSMIAYPLNSVWYLQASLIAALMILPFVKRKRINLALMLGLILYGYGLLCHNYRFLVENTVIDNLIEGYLSLFITVRNGVFYGFVFIALGIKCAELNVKETAFNKLGLGMTTVFLYLITVLEPVQYLIEMYYNSF